MCGIAGFVGRGDDRTLRAMTSAIRYRGPDDEGYFFSDDKRVGLGFRRLAIIDLRSGNQPMYNEDKSIVIVFNGEIYNYLKLRKDLERKHVFKTQSDTEVLVHLYEEYGEEFLAHADGMFAIALWDERKKKLLLARDRFGEKPLYWALIKNTLIFASEPKAIFAHPDITRELDRRVLFEYFFFEYVPAPNSIYKGVFKISPGHYLIYEHGSTRLKRYFSLLPSNPLLIDEKSAIRELDLHLDRAVKARLVSHVPLGVFLSGGVDSSTIAYYAQKNSLRPIDTFSISFEEESYDESRWARLVAEKIGSHHHSQVFTKKEFFLSIDRLRSLLDEPVADSSLVPTFLLAEFTRSRVTVALGGDGGDELLLGYPTFLAHRAWPLWHALPVPLRSTIAWIARVLPVSSRYFSLDFIVKRFIEGAHDDPLMRNQLWLCPFRPNEFRSLFTKEYLSNFQEIRLANDIRRVSKESAGEDLFRQLSYVYAEHYMTGNILAKVDRASMYNSLETRSPFLDSELATFLFNLPRSLKLRGLHGKYLLKQLMMPRLGKNVVYRRKQGFALPLTLWLKRDLKKIRDEYLAPSRIAREGIFESRYVQKILDEHDRSVYDHRKRIWTLLIFQMWNEQYGF